MASRFGDDVCGASTPYAWINFPDQAAIGGFYLVEFLKEWIFFL